MMIGEVAKQFGLKTSTLRYYESIGLLPPSPRIGGRRQYEASILERLRLIRGAQQLGFSLLEIQQLLETRPLNTLPVEQWRMHSPAKIRQIDIQIERLQQRRSLLKSTLKCQCASLEACFNPR